MYVIGTVCLVGIKKVLYFANRNYISLTLHIRNLISFESPVRLFIFVQRCLKVSFRVVRQIPTEVSEKFTVCFTVAQRTGNPISDEKRPEHEADHFSSTQCRAVLPVNLMIASCLDSVMPRDTFLFCKCHVQNNVRSHHIFIKAVKKSALKSIWHNGQPHVRQRAED